MAKRGAVLTLLVLFLVGIVIFAGCVKKKENYLFSANLGSGVFVGIKNVSISNQMVFLDEKGRETAKLAPNGTIYYVFDAVFYNPTNKPIQMPSTGLGALSESGQVTLAEPPVLKEDVYFKNGMLSPKETSSGKVRVPFSQGTGLEAFIYDSFGTESRFKIDRSNIRFNSAILVLSNNFNSAWLAEDRLQVNFTFSLGNTIPLRGDWNMYTEIFDSAGNKAGSNLLVTVRLPANNQMRSSSEFKLQKGEYFAAFSLTDLASNQTFSDGKKYAVVV